MYKINVDEATSAADRVVGVEVIIWNCEGKMTVALVKPYFQLRSVLATELLAVHEAISFCLQAGFSGREIVIPWKLHICFMTQGPIWEWNVY